MAEKELGSPLKAVGLYGRFAPMQRDVTQSQGPECLQLLGA